MNRRHLIRVSSGGGLLTAFAGCLGDFTGSASDDAVSDRTGERALDRAAGNLNDAALALSVEDDAIEDPEDVNFDPEEPRESIDEARDHLETAEAELGEDRQADVETLRTYADVLAGLVAVTDTVTDDALAEDVDAVFAAIEGDGDLSTASDVVDERTDDLETAQTRYDEAVSEFRTLGDRFEELASIDPAEFEDGIETLGTVLDSLATLGDGFESTVAGYEDLERGRKHREKNEYERAESAFRDAETAFETASATLHGDEETPAGLATYYETATCQTDHLIDAAGAFAEAADAAASGDPLTADQRRDEGEAALEDARNCAQ